MFGRAFAARFAPLTFVVATLVATGVGLAVLGAS
ncbi:permease [Mycobacteroides abscessus]|nr:permease [Mycobacteroides abscessus]